MNTLKTTLVSALTLGAMTVTFAGEAVADHKHGRGGKGPRHDVVDIYIDTGHDRQLQRVIGDYIERYNPRVNVVYNRSYADVTVKVNGYLSEPYRKNKRRGGYRGGLVAMDYDYKIKVKGWRGKTLYKDRIRGQVSERTGRKNRGYYHYGSGGYENRYSKGELAKDVFGILVDVVGQKRHRDRGGRYNLERQLTLEAYSVVAEYVSHIKIPRKGRRYR